MTGRSKPNASATLRGAGVSRRTVLRGSAAAAAVLATPGIIRAQGGGRVLVRTSGGSYQEALQAGTWNKFSEITGIEVVPVPANTAKLLAMVESGEGGLDLVEANATAVLTLESKGALDSIDTSNFEYTDPADLSIVTDQYVDYATFAEAMCYNTEAFPEKHPTSWAEFWDVEAFPGARMLQDAKAIAPNLEFALMADGVAPADLYPLDVDRAFEKLAEIKPHIVKFFDSGALGASLLAEGTAVLGSLWTNRVQALKDDGAPLAIEWNGNMRLHEFSAILKNAPNRDNALRLLDYASSPEAQAATLPAVGLSPANVKAYELIEADVAATLPGSPEIKPTGFDQDASWWLANRDEIAERWQEFLLL
jgi:putative spermidine/putrescine transport system substrate-binding protein